MPTIKLFIGSTLHREFSWHDMPPTLHEPILRRIDAYTALSIEDSPLVERMVFELKTVSGDTAYYQLL